ncbi:extensin-1-like [Vicia villosa]|uniref:extensin-1-like n=1 Tax=Vicia villosa TaxID=3911 RepID=UPI00273B8AE2|nr:extensin-1-like [Vicia villosa]
MSCFSFDEAYGDELENTKCDPPCQQYSPPPPPPSGSYPIYVAPPPPPPHHEKEKCPPGGSGVVCCTPPAPYSYGPPSPYAPPNPYTYVPYDEGEHSGGSGNNVAMQFLVPILMLFLSFILF